MDIDYRLAFDLAPIGLVLSRNRAIVDCNQRLCDMFGAQREQLRKGVTDSSLAHYDRVMRQRKSAIAEARESKCQACFVMVRPQTWQELKTNEQVRKTYLGEG